MDPNARRIYEFGRFRLDATERVLLENGRAVLLPPKVLDTLIALVENCGHIVEKDELMRRVWPDTFVEENNLNKNISALRKVLGEGQDEHGFIETVPKRGYRFVAGVRQALAQDELVVERRTRSSLEIEEENWGESKTVREQPWLPSRLPRHGLPLVAAVLGVLLLAAGLTAAVISLSNRTESKPASALPALKSVAVLPFKPLGKSESDEYLGLGMTDTLITRLSNVREMVVRPTSAVRKFSDPGGDPIAAGRELNVDSVLDGTIQRAGDKIRVTVRHVSVRDGTSLWAAQFDEKVTDVFTVQDSISQRVVNALALKLTGEEKRQLTRRYTDNADAYQLYLKGRYYLHRADLEGFKKGLDYLHQAIEKDPGFALPYAGLADSYSGLGIFGFLPPRDAMPKAREAAQKALEIDDTLAEAHASLAVVQAQYDFNLPEAERELSRAIELNPNHFFAREIYSIYLTARGRFEEARVQLERAEQLNPSSPSIKSSTAWHFYLTRQYDRALEHGRKLIEQDFYPPYQFIGQALVQKGMYEEAIAALQKARLLSGNNTFAAGRLGHAYAVARQTGEALTVLDELKQSANREYAVAWVYIGLGEKDLVFEWLEKSYEGRASQLIYLNVDPIYDPVRSDPRFAKLVARVGL
jgi:DNA-binding winged helix-turn-helix (wHTH) protein/TolB-like protein